MLALVSNKVPSRVPPLMRSARWSGASSQAALATFLNLNLLVLLPAPGFSSLLPPIAHSGFGSVSLSAATVHCSKNSLSERRKGGEGTGEAGLEGWRQGGREGGDFNTIWPVAPG